MRVSLARALYRRSAILLLDDPLAALDASTANEVFHNAVLGLAAQERLVLITSHQVSLCHPFASQEIRLRDGHAQIIALEPRPFSQYQQPSDQLTGVREAEGSHKFMTEELRETGEVKLSV